MTTPDADVFPEPVVVRYDPGPVREVIRGAITLVACGIFSLVVAFYLYQAASSGADPRWNQTKEAMQSVFPAVTSMLGTALGFYFGSQKR